MKRLIYCALLPAMLMTACRDDSDDFRLAEHGTIRTALSGYDNAGEAASHDDSMTGIAGYHFEDGTLKYIYDVFGKNGNSHTVKVNSRKGTLYIVGWSGNEMPHRQPAIGITEAEWLATEAGGKDMFYTGTANLTDAGNTPQAVNMRRGMARFDLVVDVAGEAVIRNAVIRNALPTGKLFRQSTILAQPEASTEDITLSSHAYLHEQNNANLKVRIEAAIDGKEYDLEAALPALIVRNTRHSITLRKDAVTQEISLTVVPWGDGGTSDALPDRSEAIAIDAGKSLLPDGAMLGEDGRTLTLPHSATDFILYMTGNEMLELVSAEGYLLEVTPLPVAGIESMNAFRIDKRLYAPGVREDTVTVQFRRIGLANVYPDDRIVLHLSSNPTRVDGAMNFDTEGYVHDFGRYVDNELGIFTLPAGSTLAVEFAPGEDPWLKAEAGSGNSWRILGGWRPNDPTANGRRQSATIVVSNGKSREEYTVVRRNYGLPVTWLHGIWWCKYNAMGQSTRFDDQILSSNDPAATAGMSVYDYLAACSSEEYRQLWQWAYQGSSGAGMQVVERNGLLVMDNFSMDVADHINRLPANALAPDGYELPSMDDFNRIFDATDYVWIMWNGTHTLKNPWNGHSLIKREQRRKNDVTVGSSTISDLIYIAMWSPDFPGHEPVVWYGPGAQWNADGIQHAGHYNNILFSVHSPAGEGWYMAGGMNAFYLHKNGAGNRDTRILRFKKSDVEYTY